MWNDIWWDGQNHVILHCNGLIPNCKKNMHLVYHPVFVVLCVKAINSVSNLEQLNHIVINKREFEKIMISQECKRPAN